MLQLDLAKKFRRWLRTLVTATALATAVIGGVSKTTVPVGSGQVIKSVFDFCHNVAWWTIPVLMIVGGILAWLDSRVGSTSTWRLVQYILDEQRDHFFRDKIDDAAHHHRVTLFKVKRGKDWFRHPIMPGGWLVAVARCGEFTRSNIPKFWVPYGDPDNAQGLGGLAWARRNPVTVDGLPDLNSGRYTEQDLEDYATRGRVSIEWINRRMKAQKKFARSLLAVPIEIGGQIWGVLVADSTSPDPIGSNPALEDQKFRALTGALGKVLEEG